MKSNDVITKIKNSIAYYDCRIKAWENVKRLSKKNGEDFAVFSKNFENARIYAPYGLNNKLVVSFISEHARYEIDYIDLCGTVDEQFAEISEQIERYKGWKEESEKELGAASALAEFALAKLDEITSEMKNWGISPNGSLRYAIRELVECYHI